MAASHLMGCQGSWGMTGPAVPWPVGPGRRWSRRTMVLWPAAAILTQQSSGGTKATVVLPTPGVQSVITRLPKSATTLACSKRACLVCLTAEWALGPGGARSHGAERGCSCSAGCAGLPGPGDLDLPPCCLLTDASRHRLASRAACPTSPSQMCPVNKPYSLFKVLLSSAGSCTCWGLQLASATGLSHLSKRSSPAEAWNLVKCAHISFLEEILNLSFTTQ